MTDEIEVTVAFNGPDEYQAYNDAPACLRELIYRQARELAEAASALRSSGEAAGYITEIAANVLRQGFTQQRAILHLDVTVFANKPPCEFAPIYLHPSTPPTSTKGG